jgi:hypothetical protein
MSKHTSKISKNFVYISVEISEKYVTAYFQSSSKDMYVCAKVVKSSELQIAISAATNYRLLPSLPTHTPSGYAENPDNWIVV